MKFTLSIFWVVTFVFYLRTLYPAKVTTIFSGVLTWKCMDLALTLRSMIHFGLVFSV